MLVQRVIPPREWAAFLMAFTAENRGRRAQIEVTAPLGEGQPLLEEPLPLQVIAAGPNGSGAPEVIDLLGGLDRETPRYAHVITDPAWVRVSEARVDGADGLPLDLAIEAADGDRTILRFATAPVLPTATVSAAM